MHAATSQAERAAEEPKIFEAQLQALGDASGGGSSPKP